MAIDRLGITPGAGAYSRAHKINDGTADVLIQATALQTEVGQDVSVGWANTVEVAVQRPANTTGYSIGDAWNTNSPASGGIDFPNASRAAGKSGVILDLTVACSQAPSPLLQGKLWLFDAAITAPADNAAFILNMTDLRKLVCIIPFQLVAVPNGVSYVEVAGINRAFVTKDSGSLKGVVTVENAYAPGSSAELFMRLNTVGTN